MPSEKTKGIAVSVIIHFGLCMLLIFVSFTPQPLLEEGKGLLVNFGTDETGSGFIEPSPALTSETTTVPITDPADIRKKAAPIVTQNYEESPVIKKVDPDAEKRKKEKIEADKIRKVELEAERVKKARDDAEKKRIAEERKRTNDIVNRTKNAFANARNSGTNSTSEGITGGTGNQGDPNGSVDSKVRGKNTGTGDGGPGGNGKGNGISYDLGGRNSQSLPYPDYKSQVDGKVVVDINVDRYGNVIQAIPGVKGSTTLDDYLLSAAKEAALKAKFEPKPDAPAVQKGTLTYNFVLR